MLRFAKRHRTLSSIRKISPCIKVWLYALKLLLFSNLQDPFFKSSRSFLLFHYKRISFSRLDLKMIYKSQNNRFLKFIMFFLTLSWRRPLSYRNQSIDLGSEPMDWFLYDNDLRHERLKLKLRLNLTMYLFPICLQYSSGKIISILYGKKQSAKCLARKYLPVFHIFIGNT